MENLYIHLSVGAVEQYEQACNPKYKDYFQTHILKTEVVKKSLRSKRGQRNIKGYIIVKNKHIRKKSAKV